MVNGCSIKILELDKNYGCGEVIEGSVFEAGDFPAEFVGSTSLTMGTWFKENLHLNPSYSAWSIVFKMATSNTDWNRQPGVYVGLSTNVTHDFDELHYKRKVWNRQRELWYFAMEAVDCPGGTTLLAFLDPSQTSTSQLISFFDQNSKEGLKTFSYTGDHKLYIGADGLAYKKSCLSLWNPFLITNYVGTLDTMLSLAFGIVPSSTYNFAFQPYEVYGTLFDTSDVSLVLSNQDDPTLFWSTNKQSYFALPAYSSSQEGLSSLKWSRPFRNINGSLSFSMRILFKIQQNVDDACSIYWVVRRYSSQQLVFGFGFDNTGKAVVQIKANQNNGSLAVALNSFYAVNLGCYEERLSQTVCILFIVSQAHNPLYLVFPKPNDYVETSADILLLGTGNPPWSTSSPAQPCGYVVIFSLSISQGAIALPLPDCYGGCMIKTDGPNPKCYVRDTESIACPTQSIHLNGRKECTPCPLGCSSCKLTAGATLDVTCTSCSENFTLLSPSGVCGCIGSYYLRIDPVTNQGKCVAKTHITPAISLNSSQESLIFNISASPNSFYSSLSQVSVILPTIRVYLEGVLLSSSTNYSISSDKLDQILIILTPNASISKNTIFTVDFSVYSQIEGLPTMVVTSQVNYTFVEPYYYVDLPTLQFAGDLGQYTAMGSYMDLASSSSLSLFSGGASGSSIFLLHAKGELEMYKFLNVKFPKTLFAYYYSHQVSSKIPNVYAYLNENGNVAISTYYKFGEWKTPVLFIEKYGQKIINENIVFILVIITWIPFRLCKKKGSKKPGMFEKIHYIFRWNLLISFFAADLTPFLVQIGLQFKEAPFITSDRYTILSTSISVIVLFSYFLIFAAGIYQINRKRLDVPIYMKNARKKLKARIEKERFPASLTIFIQEFKGEVRFDRNFLLIAKLEYVLLSLNYTLMQEMPLAQCYIYTIVTGFWLLMVIIGTPLKSKAGFIIFVFNQAVRLVLGIFAVVLATNDSIHFISPDMMIIVGTIMIWTVMGTLGINNLFSVGCALYSIYESIKKRSSRNNRNLQNKKTRVMNDSARHLRQPDISYQTY